MNKTDQWNYDEMVSEADTLRMHLYEWAEQLDEHASKEGAFAWDAYRIAEVVCQRMKDAQQENQKANELRVEQSLQRVAIGTSTEKDAEILREAIK
jgi:hypothetical protein